MAMEVVVYAARCAPGGEHQAAWDLLALALERERGISSLPETAEGAGGKPFFPDRPDLCFNLSHSRGVVVCALHDKAVGVDIEGLRQPPRRLGRGMGSEEFFRRWTAREASVKHRGGGIANLLREEEWDPLCRCLEGLLPGWVVTVCPSEPSVIRGVQIGDIGAGTVSAAFRWEPPAPAGDSRQCP